MKFLQNDLGRRERGEVVEVTLSAAANVRLMDSSTFPPTSEGRSTRIMVVT